MFHSTVNSSCAQQSRSLAIWNEFHDYEQLAMVWDDDALFVAVQPSGPRFGGFRPTADEEFWRRISGCKKDYTPYELCEFYFFRLPVLRKGFQPAQGGVLMDVPNLYPEAWEFLQTPEGQKLCKTEEEWQAMSTETWATLADGTKIGWDGTGGVPFYAPDFETGKLRLPDVRGMYAEASGFDGLGVGGVHGDATRRVTGMLRSYAPVGGPGVFAPMQKADGALFSGGGCNNAQVQVVHGDGSGTIWLDTGWATPTAAKNQPRAWGALACVYLGKPGCSN